MVTRTQEVYQTDMTSRQTAAGLILLCTMKYTWEHKSSVKRGATLTSTGGTGEVAGATFHFLQVKECSVGTFRNAGHPCQAKEKDKHDMT